MTQAHLQPRRKQAQLLRDDAVRNINTGRIEPGVELLRQAVALVPAAFDIRTELGRALALAGRFAEAEAEYTDILRAAPEHAATLNDYAALLFRQERFPECILCLRKLVARADAKPSTWARLLMLLESTGKLDEAAELAGKIKPKFPGHPAIALIEAKVLRRAGRAAEGIALIEPGMQRMKLQGAEASPFYFELAQLYERAGESDKAFEWFTRANTAQRASPEMGLHGSVNIRDVLTRIRQEFTADLVPAAPAPADGLQAPVFLVGFPRSGTTLLDQILSSHPNIHVAEEKPVIETIGKRLVQRYADAVDPKTQHAWFDPVYPGVLAKMDANDTAEFRRAYFELHALDPADPRIFVDKLPLNLLKAGLIKRLFPDAKFILALRHPCDSVLSCFMQEFRLNLFMAQFLDIGDAAKFYDVAFSLWEHYRSALDLDVHELRYEDVVSDFRPAVAALLEFLGLEWDDAVLKYDETAKRKERINTPSYSQVTEKIYTRAKGRWLKYRKHMEPVLEILAPHAKRYGYAMDDENTK